MGKLQDLFNERQKTFSQISEKILSRLKTNVIPAISELLELSERELNRLEWNGVTIADDHVLLTGVIIYAPGDVVSDENTKVQLTEEMVGLMNKLIKVAIPLEIAENASKEDVVKHMVKAENELRDEYSRAYGKNALGHSEHFGWEEIDEEIINEVIETVTDFKLSNLTEEQKEALMLTHLGQHGRGKIN